MLMLIAHANALQRRWFGGGPKTQTAPLTTFSAELIFSPAQT